LDYHDNKRRVDALRVEVEQICEQYRGYLSRKQHSELDKAAFERRRMRVVEIRAELASMVNGGRKRP